MKLSWEKVSGSQFTLYMTISNLGFAYGAYLLGYLKENLEWETILFIIAIFPLIGIFIFKMINVKKNRKVIEQLEIN